MGLDITAYKNLTPVDNPEFDEEGCLVNWNTQWLAGKGMKWSEKWFTGRGEGIDSDQVYTWEDCYDFRAGGYGEYNAWRRTLDVFRGDEAFQELIDFADNEGVIGFVVAKKLLKDFNDYEESAKAFSETLGDKGMYWFKSYKDWQKAFEYASQNGAVNFC